MARCFQDSGMEVWQKALSQLEKGSPSYSTRSSKTMSVLIQDIRPPRHKAVDFHLSWVTLLKAAFIAGDKRISLQPLAQSLKDTSCPSCLHQCENNTALLRLVVHKEMLNADLTGSLIPEVSLKRYNTPVDARCPPCFPGGCKLLPAGFHNY